MVAAQPLGDANEVRTGYSDFDRQDVPVFYGEEKPGRLYQREWMLAGAEPALASLHQDDGALDFWLF